MFMESCSFFWSTQILIKAQTAHAHLDAGTQLMITFNIRDVCM